MCPMYVKYNINYVYINYSIFSSCNSIFNGKLYTKFVLFDIKIKTLRHEFKSRNG
jgi:hypothetical protein